MSRLGIHGITVSVDWGDKNFGKGNGRFMSLSTRLPDDAEGIPLTELDEVMRDGVDLYLAAWQTMMQTRYATGEITLDEYKTQTAAALVRIARIQQLYTKIKGKTTEELEAFLKKVQESTE